MHIRKGGEVDPVVVLQALHRVPAFATSSDEGDVEPLIGSEDRTREDLHTSEGGGGFAEEVTTVEHGMRALLEWFTPKFAQVHGIEMGTLRNCGCTSGLTEAWRS